MVNNKSRNKIKRKNGSSELGSSKRTRLGSTSEDSADQFKPLFEDLFESAKYDRINPFACIRIAKIRPITSGGVRRLRASFSKRFEIVDKTHPDGLCSTGLAFGSDTPLVVELTGDLLHLLVAHFEEEGLSPGKEIEEAIAAHDKWYGIIDGGHSNEAVRSLCTELPEWNGFKWFVTVIAGGHPLERYRQLARAQNSRHSPRFYIEMTLFDEINNLYLEREELIRCQMNPTQMQVARAYFGTDDVSNTRKYLTSMAFRLDSTTLKELGKIMNEERPAECLEHESFDSGGASSADGLQSSVDCRIFRKFLTLHSLRMSTVFMKASTSDELRARVYTLHRAKESFLLNGLKSVQYTTINQQYHMSMLAIAEEKKFSNYFGSDEWPSAMSTVRRNLLQSTVLDSEIESNQGNEHTVLDALRKSLMVISPNTVSECDKRFQESIEGTSAPVPEVSDDVTPPAPPTETDTLPTAPVNTTAEKVPTPEEVEKHLLESKLKDLHSHGIDCVNMDWRDYFKRIWDSNRPSLGADTLLIEPPCISSRSFLGLDGQSNIVAQEEELSEDDVIYISKALKRILKPGGYAIVLMTFDAFGEWYTAFRKAGVYVMPRLYVIGYSQDSIQDRNPTQVPQAATDYAMIAYLPSDEPFCPDFKSPSSVIGSKLKRNLALITDITAPRVKLCRPGSRSPFLVNEKSVKLLMELIDLFTPRCGFVVDLFGGSLTTALAAKLMRRSCLCFEKKTDLFKAAVGRLWSSIPLSNMVDSNRSNGRISLNDSQNDQTGVPHQFEADQIGQRVDGTNELTTVVQMGNKKSSPELDERNEANSTASTEPTIHNEQHVSVIHDKDFSVPINSPSCQQFPDDSDPQIGEQSPSNTSQNHLTKSIPKENRPVGNGLEALASAAELETTVNKTGIKRVTSMPTDRISSLMRN